MKLPGQQRLAVQSLGRQDSSLEMRIAQSKVGLTDAITQSVASVTTAVNREIVEPAYQREAVAQYAKAESDRATILTAAEAKINNPTGMVPIEKVPTWVDYREFDKDESGEPVRRTHIPTYEIADEWYRGEMKRSQEKVMFEMTNAQAMRKMKADYGAAYLNNYAGVLLQAQKRKQATELADMDMSVERFVEGGDTAKAETLILGGIKTGVIGPKEGTERLMAIPGDVDAYRTSRAIHTAETVGELDDIVDHIYRDYNWTEAGEIALNEDLSRQSNPMSFDQRKTLIKEVEARQRALEIRHKEGKDVNSQEVLNERLITLQDKEPFDEEQMREFGNDMTPEDHKILITSNNSRAYAMRGQSDPLVLGQLQMDINQLMIHDPDQPINLRRSALIDRINTATMNQQLNAQDSWSQIQRVQAVQAIEFIDQKKAIDHIYKELVQGSKDSIGLSASSLDVANASRAEIDMMDAARVAGPGFEPFKWWDANRGRYLTGTYEENRIDLNQQKADAYFISTPGGGYDIPAIEAKLKAAIRANTISPEVRKLVSEELIAVEDKMRRRAERAARDE